MYPGIVGRGDIQVPAVLQHPPYLVHMLVNVQYMFQRGQRDDAVEGAVRKGERGVRVVQVEGDRLQPRLSQGPEAVFADVVAYHAARVAVPDPPRHDPHAGRYVEHLRIPARLKDLRAYAVTFVDPRICIGVEPLEASILEPYGIPSH